MGEERAQQKVLLFNETMKAFVAQKFSGLRTTNVKGKSSVSINHSTSVDYHFLTEFSYQMVMITNNNESAQVEIKSDFPKN